MSDLPGLPAGVSVRVSNEIRLATGLDFLFVAERRLTKEEKEKLWVDDIDKTDRLLTRRSCVKWHHEVKLDGLFNFVGQTAPPRPNPLGVTQVPENLQALLGEYPELAQFQFPEREPSQNIAALLERANAGHRPHVPYEPDEREFVLDQMMFDDVPNIAPPQWLAERRLPTNAEIAAKVCKLSPDSNPGFPYNFAGESKRDFAVAHFPYVANKVRDRILALLEQEPLEDVSPVDAVKRGLVDPTLAFEKDEAYKRGKSPRLIIMGSVIDELIDRLITDEHDQFELDNYGRYYSMCGIGFDRDHHDHVVHSVKVMCDDLRSIGFTDPENITESDVSAFDFNMKEPDAMLENEVVVRRYGLQQNNFAVRVMTNRTRVSMYSVYVFTDGTMLAQRKRGIQKSGLKRTTSRNTNVRRINFLRALYRAQPGLCRDLPPNFKVPTRGVGDDMLEPCIPGIEQQYINLGVTIKSGSFKRCSSRRFQTCSHVWGEGQTNPVPLNAAKAAFTLLCCGPMPDKYAQFLRAFWFASDRPRYMALFDRLGWPVGQSKKQKRVQQSQSRSQ